MVYLIDGVLKNAYDKVINTFENVIDCNTHKQAYIGDHADIEAFAESEFAGKYLDCCVNLYKSSKSKKILHFADELVRCIIQNQHDNGYMGGYPQSQEWYCFSIWNQAFTVYGLLSYYKLTGDNEALECAEKCVKTIAKHYMDENNDILDAWNNGTQNLSILLVLPDLYNITGDKLYIDFINCIYERLKKSTNNFFDFETILNLYSKKGIENFIVLISMMLCNEISYDEETLEGARRYWNELEATQIRRTGNGTLAELWTPGGNAAAFYGEETKPNETCVAVGWCEFSMLMFMADRKSIYLDAIEKSLYNHILGSLSNDGTDFAYYQPNYGRKILRTNSNLYKCCRYRGFNIISRLHENLFLDDDCITPTIYTSCVFTNEKVKITETTKYPFDDTISFKIEGTSDKKLRLRIPRWCKKYDIRVNGELLCCKKNDGFVILDINDGDEIELSLNTALKTERVIIDDKEHLGFSYGWIVLVPDSSICGDIYSPKSDIGDFKRNYETEYNIQFDSNDLKLVDYLSAAKRHETDEYTEWVLKKQPH